MHLAWGGAAPLDLRKLGQGLFHGLFGLGRCDTGLFDERRRQPLVLFEERQEEVLRIDALVASAQGMGRGRLQRFLQLHRHAIHVHVGVSRVQPGPGLRTGAGYSA